MHDNYQSYKECQAEADELFNRERKDFFCTWSASRKELERLVGQLVPSAVGVIVKVRKAGTRKYRLVDDLRRSRINEHTRFVESEDAKTCLQHIETSCDSV